MGSLKEWHNETIGIKTAAALQKRNFSAVYVADKKEALSQILKLIPADASVGVGGSATLQEIGLLPELETRGNPIYNHGRPGISKEEAVATRRLELTADVFLTGTNAITMDGELINVDGTGNRVAAMSFGPKKVIVVAGVNKIVPNLAAGIDRVKLVAAPMNNKRLNFQNPCVFNGKCMDCQAPTRICNITTIIHQKPSLTDIHIFIIGENLGF